MRDLVRRDPLIRALPKWLAVSALGATLVVNVLTYLALAGRHASDAGAAGGAIGTDAHLDAAAASAPQAAVFWASWLGYALPLAAFTILVVRARRCRPLECTLPLPAPRLWLAHLAAALLAGVALLLPIVAVMATAHRWLVPQGLLPAASAAQLKAWPAASAYALACALVLSVRPGLAVLPAGARRGWLTLGAVLGVLAVSAALHRWPAWLALVPTVAAAAVAARTWRTLPPSLLLVERVTGAAAAGGDRERAGAAVGFAAALRPFAAATAGAGPGPGATAAARVSSRDRAALAKVVWRTTHSSPKLVFNAVFLLLFAAVLSNMTERAWGMSEGQFLLFLPMTWYLLLVSLPMEMGRFHVLDALPLSRRRLFAAWVGPTWAVVVAGYLLGVAVGDRYEPRRELLMFASFRPGAPPTLLVPLTSWELAWDGQVPPATAPWGETQTPVSQPLWRGGRPVFYKPFSTPAGSSERFVAWQIARAAAAVYGASLDPEELRSRYLATDGGGQVTLSTPSLSLVRDHPALRPVARGPLMPLVMLLVGVPWALLLALALRLHRPGVTARARRIGLVGIPAGIMAVHVAGVALAMSHVLDYDGLSATVVILTRRLGAALPGGAWGLWVAALAVLAMVWWWVAGQFARIEFAPSPRRQREAA